jgi:hypothetical protein
MSRNRWARIARQAMARFDIPYSTALQSCRDVHEDPRFEDRMKALKDQGKTYTEAMLQMIDEDFEFYDAEA